MALAFVHPPQTDDNVPQRLLKAFGRVHLAPGESRQLHLTIAKDALRRYDAATKEWYLPRGTYRIAIGDQSAEIAL